MQNFKHRIFWSYALTVCAILVYCIPLWRDLTFWPGLFLAVGAFLILFAAMELRQAPPNTTSKRLLFLFLFAVLGATSYLSLYVKLHR
jgi:peptidoglycan/LPS O-acetylase OafA/YrhL